jgi:hypothetical protein
MVTVMMIAAEVVGMEAVMIIVDTAEMIVTEAMAATAMIMALELIDMEAVAVTIDTAAAAVMTDAEVVEDMPTVMIEVTVALLGMAQHQPPMAIQHPVGRLGNHTEVVSALLVKLARFRRRNNSFGSAVFINAGALPLVHSFSCFHHGPKLRAAEYAQKRLSTPFYRRTCELRVV